MTNPKNSGQSKNTNVTGTNKRKNSGKNVSGERQHKLQVTDNQSGVDFSVPRLSGTATKTTDNQSSVAFYSCSQPAPPYMNYQVPPLPPFPPATISASQPQFMYYNQQTEKSLEAKLDVLNTKIDSVSSKLELLDSIDTRLSKLEAAMIIANEDLKEVKRQVVEMDEGLTNLNTQCEENRTNLAGLKREAKAAANKIEMVRKDGEQTKDEVKRLEKNFIELNEKQVIDQWRAMRDNLIFSGIAEVDEEDTEATLREFLRDEMKITKTADGPIEFDRVHRLGRADTENPGKTRPIVAKFTKHKVREEIRKLAPTTLHDKPGFGVNEQFPREINERRKRLYPHMKIARKQGKKAVLVRDKLFIEGTLFTQTPGQDMNWETDRGMERNARPGMGSGMGRGMGRGRNQGARRDTNNWGAERGAIRNDRR